MDAGRSWYPGHALLRPVRRVGHSAVSGHVSARRGATGRKAWSATPLPRCSAPWRWLRSDARLSAELWDTSLSGASDSPIWPVARRGHRISRRSPWRSLGSHHRRSTASRLWSVIPPCGSGSPQPGIGSGQAGSDGHDAIKQIFDGSRGRYGARKVWHQLRREGSTSPVAQWSARADYRPSGSISSSGSCYLSRARAMATWAPTRGLQGRFANCEVASLPRGPACMPSRVPMLSCAVLTLPYGISSGRRVATPFVRLTSSSSAKARTESMMDHSGNRAGLRRGF
ncbi:hypothetical protein DPM13_16485 [Paracoccus mutanolyticus]|uniref:HTH-like domain-containing protein n=1 Tax=Paracoccus mutanolyticus TaxID=1499308 RepID=A0ABN5MBF4_9RHOB|nr:hypothetical protein DPM13_16485 [Paracoccus mutanolyticus]